MTKHTPGPWTMHPRFADGAEVRSLAQVAWCGSACEISKSGGQRIDAAEARANAHLIAAAPDLLQGLEDMIGHCQGCNGKGRCYGPVPGRPGVSAVDQPCQDCSDARAAIKKARGES